jgi:CRISPR-associated endonuclease/helicase Cas3
LAKKQLPCADYNIFFSYLFSIKNGGIFMPFRELESHPGIWLGEHLKNVAEAIRSKILEIFPEKFPIDRQILADIGYLIGLLHDFGKCTPFFQDHLKKDSDKDPRSHHSSISAFIAAEIIQNYINLKIKQKKIDDIPGKMLVTLSYISIRRHHGDLLSLEDELNCNSSEFGKEWKIIEEQARTIMKIPGMITEFQDYLFQMMREREISEDANQILPSLSKIIELLQNSSNLDEKLKLLSQSFVKFSFTRDLKSNDSIKYYILNQVLFSILIDSDKKIAADLDTSNLRVRFPPNCVETYVQTIIAKSSKSDIELKKLRSNFFEEINKISIENFEKSNKSIFSLTAPTGIGKTFAVLNFAFKYREFLTQKCSTPKDIGPRIIYCLPFTSIIDQNYDVIYKMFSQMIPKFADQAEQFLLKHHHLSEIVYRKKDSDNNNLESSNDDALMLTEAWDSELIVTTFYQLFHTLFGYENSILKKFHKFCDAIIILDEIQSFPPQYWNLLRQCLLFLTKHFRTKVILLTATQPAIFDGEEIHELIPKPEYYYTHRLLNRIEFEFQFEPVTVSNLVDRFHPSTLKYQSIMFVANTITESIKFIEEIMKKYQENMIPVDKIESSPPTSTISKEKFILVYLSTNILPKTRKNRIDMIKKFIDDKQPFLVVTTQLIEAGVDIDTEIVVRDLGPLDSIIQVAGRCNRNRNFTSLGKIYLFKIYDDKNKIYAEKVYDPALLTRTTTLLELNKTKQALPWNEGVFPDLSTVYFSELKKNYTHSDKYFFIISNLIYGRPKSKSDSKSHSCIQNMRQFHLIEEKPDCDVLILADDEAKKIDCDISELRKKIKHMRPKENLKEYFRLKRELKTKQQKLREYTISVPRYIITKLKLEMKNNYVKIRKEEFVHYYDSLTGFKRSIEEIDENSS